MRKKADPPFVRNCPECGAELEYSNVKNRNQAEKLGKRCRSCAYKEINSRPGIGKARIVNRRSYAGDQNPFFGKIHSNETKEKLSNVDRSYTQTKKFRRNSARVGTQNGMYGKSFYDVWKEQYGQEEADKRFSAWLKVQSKNSSGENNPMYGKPSPKGSGGGWGGWYKGWYFRSLREFSYMVNVIEAKKYRWENAECDKFAIPYIDFNGVQRTYRPDFLINGRILVEIKPKRLMATPTNVLKKEAALAYCNEKGLEYSMIDVRVMKTKKLVELFKSGDVKFNKKYQKRMEMICTSMKNKK